MRDARHDDAVAQLCDADQPIVEGVAQQLADAMQGGVKVGDVRRHLSDLTEHVQLAAAPIARRALVAGQADIARHHGRSSATPRAWRLLRGSQERLEVGDAITAVPARIDAQDWQPLCWVQVLTVLG
jgi:hypothetical protein